MTINLSLDAVKDLAEQAAAELSNLQSVLPTNLTGLAESKVGTLQSFLSKSVSSLSPDLNKITSSLPSPDDILSSLPSIPALPSLSSVTSLLSSEATAMFGKIDALKSQAENLIDQGVGLDIASLEKIGTANAAADMIKANVPTIPGKFSAQGIVASLSNSLPAMPAADMSALLSGASNLPTTFV